VKSFSFLFIATTALATVLLAAAMQGRVPAVAATPPPTPPPIGTPQAPMVDQSLPTPSASYAPASPAPKLSASPSPPPNARKGLDGVWEVQIQHPSGTDYTHFKVAQEGVALTGTYLDARGKHYPLSGTVDGQAVRIIVTMPDGTTLLLEGKLDGTTDMIGMLTTAGGEVPFTASYRPKEKWIENVNPSPGGVSQPGGYTPP
jgi:hypothetical protein